jgi:pyruvate formate lyase activating enzyme
LGVRVVGLVETSLIDWDGKIASVLFVGGCNFHCPFCHNHQVAADDRSLPEVKWPEVSALLERKLGWLDAVVVSGGEPMMHPEVFDLCRRIHKFGVRVKVDTNGSFPYSLKKLIRLGLVDYVAMDVKAPLGPKYSAACGRPIDVAPIRRSIRLLQEGDIEYEFRSTLVPGLIDPEDVPELGRALSGARVVALQQFNPENARTESLRGVKPYTLAQAEAMAQQLRPLVREVRLRGKFL